MIFPMKLAFEEQMESYGMRKPPDDGSGLLVATLKEPERHHPNFDTHS